MTTQALTINFYNTDLFVVEHNGQPYTPMKSIVEGMGLAWQSQLSKLNANPERWGITKIVIPTLGDMQEAVCMPLRKLAGWLASIHPNKVKPELRETIIHYQNECDDVLWNHWQKQSIQLSTNRLQLPEPPTITKAQIGVLFNRVNGICAGSGKIRAELWSRFQNHFNLASYKDLPAECYEEALTYLDAKETEYLGGPVQMLYISNTELETKVQEQVKALEGELLGKSAPLPRREVRGGIYEAGEQIAITSFYQKEELLRHFGQLGYDLVNRNDYIVIKKDDVLKKLQA